MPKVGVFVLWLRLPGIIADIAIVLELLRQRRIFGLGWGWLALAAASPLHIMICGFHGNLDGVVAAGIFFAFSAAVSQRPLLSGLLLGLACHIKISPVLFAPALAAYWLGRGQAWRFCLSFGLTAGAMLAMGWSVAGIDFVKHVLSYGSIWGNWGIGEALVALGYSIPQIPFKGYTDPLAAFLAPSLKAIIVAMSAILAWRGRRGDALALFRTGAVNIWCGGSRSCSWLFHTGQGCSPPPRAFSSSRLSARGVKRLFRGISWSRNCRRPVG